MAIQYKFATKNFTVIYSDEEEQLFDLSWDDTGEVRAKLDSGEWQMFAAKVAVLFRGNEIASEYLGGCIYDDPAKFRDHVGNRGRYGSYFRDMVTSAIENARRTLADMPHLRAPLLSKVTPIPERTPAALPHIVPDGWEEATGGARSFHDWQEDVQ